MTNDRYKVKGPDDADNSVQVWSSDRLSYPPYPPPKAWMRELRNEIRSAVQKVQASDDAMLHAQYVSVQEDKYKFDVENVLLYNVDDSRGVTVFDHLCRQGLSFERGFAVPPAFPGADAMPHYHYYGLTGLDEQPLYWVKEGRLAGWTGVKCPPLHGENKPASCWYAMKQAEVFTARDVELSRYFGIELTINSPRNHRMNLPAVIKPLLDGVVSAFHAHDGSGNSVIVERLAKLLDKKESIIEYLLMDRRHAVLGIRELLHQRGPGVIWNPADDLCVTARILLNDSMEDGIWSLDGEIFTMIPRLHK